MSISQNQRLQKQGIQCQPNRSITSDQFNMRFLWQIRQHVKNNFHEKAS